MASPLNTINLIRTKTSSSPQFESIETSLRRTGYIALSIFLCISVVLAVVYFFFIQEKGRLEGTKQTLSRELTSNVQKEGMARSIKDRTRIVKSVMANQKSWAQLLDRVSQIVSPPTLYNVSVDDQSKISISIRTDSIEKILDAVTALIAQAKDNRIVNPQLLSFQVAKTGNITVTISFSMAF